MAQANENRRKDDVRIEALSERMAELETNVKAIKANTDDIVAFFEAGRGFFVVVRWTGTLAKWIAYIAAAVGIAWAITKFGVAQIIADLKPPK